MDYDEAVVAARSEEDFWRDVVVPQRTDAVLADLNEKFADLFPPGCKFVMEPLDHQ